MYDVYLFVDRLVSWFLYRGAAFIDDFRGEISPMGEIKGPLIFYWTNFLY
jgi:hypothetical protein